MSRLTRGQAALIARQTAGASPAGTLTYTRTADQSHPIDLTGKAWVGRTVFTRLPVASGAAIVFGDRDYLIPVSVLPAEPDRGDRITEVVNGQTLTFELIAPANEPAWRYSDQLRTLYRVHCKEVAVP